MVRPLAAHADPAFRLTPESLHQMRIALRQLRTALPIFAEFAPVGQTARLRRELKWLSGRLGASRDLQTMQQQLARKGTAGSALLLDRVAVLGAAEFKNAEAAVAQRRFAALVAAVERWIATVVRGSCAMFAPPGAPARRFARHHLARRAKRVAAKAADLERLDEEKRHRLRIAAKKLFYAIGLFEHLFKGHKTKKRIAAYAKDLKRLLRVLGALNDLAVRRELARRMLRTLPATASQRRAALEAVEPDPVERDKLQKSAARYARKLVEARPFKD